MPERLKLWHDACTFCFWHMPAVYLLPNSRTHFLTRYAREIAGSSFGVIAKKGGRMMNASTNTTLSRRACQMPRCPSHTHAHAHAHAHKTAVPFRVERTKGISVLGFVVYLVRPALVPNQTVCLIKLAVYLTKKECHVILHFLDQ